MFRNTTLNLLMILSAVALVLAACGGTDDEPAAATPAIETDLEGTAWLLESLNGVDVDLQEPVTISFDNGQAGGFSGCNTYGGAFTASATGDFSMPEIEQTDMACETGMDLEADYLAALQQTQHYKMIDGQRLELSDADGETTLVFTLDEREALDGTDWEAIEIDGDEPIAEARPTLKLQAGEISGSTGCNQFGGEYTANDAGEIGFSALFWTERGCIDQKV